MIAGLSGHQQIGDDQTVVWVEQQLLIALVTEGVTEGCTSLAIGADQLFARTLLKKGLPFRVVVPCVGYDKTFSGQDREMYFSLLSRASVVTTLDFDRPSEAAFYEAGKHVVDRSDILIAVWDGLAARGLGGTADVVRFAQGQRKRVIHLDTSTHSVRVI